MEIPIYYDYATQLQNVVSPGSVHAKDALITRFYTDYLLKRAMSVLEFGNMPENWDMNYFMYVLYCRGFVCVMKSKNARALARGSVIPSVTWAHRALI